MPVLAAFLLLATPQAFFTAEYRLTNRVVSKLDRRMFGHFMERPSWGDEVGIEAAIVAGTSKLQPSVESRLKELAPPVLRFPHGTDADYVNWTDMISNAPGRANPTRPNTTGHQGGVVSNRFGYDEFFQLAERLSSETIVSVRFRDGLLGLKDLDGEARHAAALVAYAVGGGKGDRGDKGGKTSLGLAAYSAARRKNGRAKPYRLDYVQIGNETWFFMDDLKRRYPQDPVGRYVLALEKFVDAIHAVDPRVKIIADGPMTDVAERIRQRLGNKVALLADHSYYPWEINEVRRNGQPVPIDTLTPAEIWHAWTAVSPINPATGETEMRMYAIQNRSKHGYPIAVTEWNWNGWWGPNAWRIARQDSPLAKGVGAAGLLHAMMRQAGNIDLACMSMTVGKSWEIDAIRVDPTGREAAFFQPTGQVVRLYNLHHGDRVLELERQSALFQTQPLSFNAVEAVPKLALTDVVATADDKAVYLHVINRSFDKPIGFRVNLSGYGALSGRGDWHMMVGRIDRDPQPGEPREPAQLFSKPLTFNPQTLSVTLPARSVSVMELRR